jgi:hypothetical protein
MLTLVSGISLTPSKPNQEYKENTVGYKVLADKFQMDEMRTKYGPRKGLEGPFNFSGRVLYYDTKEGQYYDPQSDFYVEQTEMDQIHNQLIAKL